VAARCAAAVTFICAGQSVYCHCREAVSSDQPPALLQVFEAITGISQDGSRGRLTAGYEIASLGDIVANDWAAYRRDPTVNEIFLPHGIRDVVALDMHRCEPNGIETDVRVAVYQDRYGSARFGATGAAMFRLLPPAMRSAVCARIRQSTQFQAHTAELSQLLDAIPGGALLADAAGRILRESPSFGRLHPWTPSGPRSARRWGVRCGRSVALAPRSACGR